jgi:hypothetical protein
VTDSRYLAELRVDRVTADLITADFWRLAASLGPGVGLGMDNFVGPFLSVTSNSRQKIRHAIMELRRRELISADERREMLGQL